MTDCGTVKDNEFYYTINKLNPGEDVTIVIEAKSPGVWGNAIYVTFENTNENER